jgi:hypothetical protein
MNEETGKKIFEYIIDLAVLYAAFTVGTFKENLSAKHDMNTTPIVVESRDFNKDGIEDRIFKSDEGLYQVQFGVKDGKDSTKIIYLTKDQLEQRTQKEYKDIQKKYIEVK